MNPENFMLEMVQHLAWPVVALIAFVGVRKHIVALAKAAANLRELMSNTGGVVLLVERLSEVKNEAAEIKEMLETISIKDKAKELQDLIATESTAADQSPDEMFEQIRSEWKQVADTIRYASKLAGVKSNLTGTIGVSATVDELVAKQAIPPRAAELVKALSSQWQWMFRTTSPKNDWLNASVFRSFVNGATEARTALGA